MAIEKKKIKKSVKPGLQVSVPVWPLGEKQTFWLFFGLTLVLTLILFSRYLFGSELFIFDDVGSDTLTMFYPNLVQNARYVRENGIPGWSFYIGLGGNFYPGTLLSPLHWVYIPMNAATIAHSIAWVQATILFATGLVFYRFLKEAMFSLPVCIIGSVLYTYGGYLVVGSAWYGHSTVIFWMTLSFLGFELLIRKKNWWLFIIPFVIMLDVRSYFLILFMIIYSFVRIMDVYEFSWRELLRNYKRLMICGVVALLVCLPFVGGNWHRFANSPRVSGRVSYSENLSSVFPFRTASQEHYLTAFFRLISNDGVGTANAFNGWKNYLEAPLFYIGLLTIFLVFQFFALASRKRKILYGCFLGLWVFMIIFPWFRFAFYGFAGDYYKGALSLFIPFSFLFVGLLGFQEILNGKKPSLVVLGLSLLLMLCLIWFPYHEPKVTISQAVQLKATLFLTSHALLLWLLKNDNFKKIILPSILALAVIEAGVFSWPAFNERGSIQKDGIETKKYQFDYSMEAVEYIKKNDPGLFYRIDKIYGSVKSGYNDGMVQDFFGSKMYQSHNHKNYVRFLDEMGIIDGSQEKNTRWLLGLSNNQYLHSLFSIKYLLSKPNAQVNVNPALYDRVTKTGDVEVYANKYFLPFGIPFDQYIDYDDFRNVPYDQKQGAIYQGVILEDEVIEGNFKLDKVPFSSLGSSASDLINLISTLPDKSMKMEYFSQNRIIGSIQLSKPSVVFFSLPFDAGWKVKVDDAKSKLIPVDIGFTGLYVEPGKHVIELYYEPPLSKIGWIGFIGAFALGFVIYRNKEKFWK
ncbi:MAG: YfhO family protein [Saprospiraceae bacterium]|nr:YfhO family protein [Saprospiraceae bacterium]